MSPHQSRLRFLSALAVAAMGVGCGAGPKVPSAYAGDVPITIINHHSATVCTFVMFHDGDGKLINWLGTGSKRGKLPTGATHEFRVQPGVYNIGAAGCSDGETWAAVKKKVHIGGPTRLSVGGHEPHVPGTLVVTLPVRNVQVQQASGGEEEAPAAAPEEKKNCVPEGGHTTDSKYCCGPMSAGSSPDITCK